MKEIQITEAAAVVAALGGNAIVVGVSGNNVDAA
jgi:NaMN:DMB phosphoribosyltransferase